MCDPLSVAASIAGLLSLAGQIYTVVDSFISTVQDVPSFAIHIRSKVDSFRNSLNALHRALESPIVRTNRAALIPADSIILACTNATLLFSEIEAIVLPIAKCNGPKIWYTSQWIRKKEKLEAFISRLQWQKLTLVLQLNILNWYKALLLLRCAR